MISKELEGTLNVALKEAKAAAPRVRLLGASALFALLKDKDAKAAIVTCGGDVERLAKIIGGIFQRPVGNPARRAWTRNRNRP
mgnify:CR=1 FL=1